MKIYVASSWRNNHQPGVVKLLRTLGHSVYDFRNPAPGDTGFSWSSISLDWQKWNSLQYVKGLKHPLAISGYEKDLAALKDCDVCILVLPAGRSASWEFGFAAAAGKKLFVYAPEPCEPELMFLESEFLFSEADLKKAFSG